MDSKFLKVTHTLQKYHGIFCKIWQMGKPTLTDKIDTAAVAFNKDGGFIEFLFNPSFFEKLDDEELGFVCAHECLHVILNHGSRLKGLDKNIGNVAADIAINEILLAYFKFKLRADTALPKLCLISSVFPKAKPGQVQKHREFEYYYNLIKNEEYGSKAPQSGEGEGTLDYHGYLPDESMDEIGEAIEQLSKEEIESLSKFIKPGDSDSFEWIQTALKPKKVRTWEKVIRNWTVKAYRDKMQTQWRHTNRRFAVIEQYTDLLIPSDYDIDDKKAEKIDMTFFMDISGSCHAESEKFFQAAKTIPTDKFVIDAYAFNTRVIKIDLKSDKLPSGGGTAFDMLETHLLSQRVYPTAVFVLTDGYGTTVKPKYPDRWHVFLTMDYKDCFPKGVNFHSFQDIMKCM